MKVLIWKLNKIVSKPQLNLEHCNRYHQPRKKVILLWHEVSRLQQRLNVDLVQKVHSAVSVGNDRPPLQMINRMRKKVFVHLHLVTHLKSETDTHISWLRSFQDAIRCMPFVFSFSCNLLMRKHLSSRFRSSLKRHISQFEMLKLLSLIALLHSNTNFRDFFFHYFR